MVKVCSEIPKSGASLVRVQQVHLHPLRFAMGAMHPSSGGFFVLRTENQGKLWGIFGSWRTFYTHPIETLARPLYLMNDLKFERNKILKGQVNRVTTASS